jgi:predicted Zn-dependent peptidase
MKNGLIWQRKILSNGLKVLLYPRDSALTTQIGVAIKYGANMDPILTSGRAHFLEHMVSCGSEKRINLSRKIEHLGGYYNSSTNHEYTFSIVDLVPDKIIKGAAILSDILFDSYFEQEKFYIERKRILNELSDVFDNPFEIVNHMLRTCLFRSHPIKREILGTRKSLNSLILDDIVEAHEDYYIPPNMILVITGKFNQKDADIIVNNFLTQNSHKASFTNPLFCENGEPKRKKTKLKTGLTQTYINIGARTVPSKHPDSYIMDLIDSLLGDGFSSRLYVEVCEKLGLSYSISTANECGLDYGFFNIACSIKPKNLDFTVSVIHNELEKLCTKRVDKKELRKAKDMIRGDLLRVVDDPMGSSELFASCEIKYETESAIINYLQKIDSVLSDDIIDVANRYLHEDILSLATLSPKSFSDS